jgi:hypothetical protein
MHAFFYRGRQTFCDTIILQSTASLVWHYQLRMVSFAPAYFLLDKALAFAREWEHFNLPVYHKRFFHDEFAFGSVGL